MILFNSALCLGRYNYVMEGIHSKWFLKQIKLVGS